MLAEREGFASTINDRTPSGSSQSGQKLVWIATPREGITSTYPDSAFATAWDASFGAPVVSGKIALQLETRWDMRYSDVAEALDLAKPVNPGGGRLNALLAVPAAK